MKTRELKKKATAKKVIRRNGPVVIVKKARKAKKQIAAPLAQAEVKKVGRKENAFKLRSIIRAFTLGGLPADNIKYEDKMWVWRMEKHGSPEFLKALGYTPEFFSQKVVQVMVDFSRFIKVQESKLISRKYPALSYFMVKFTI